MRLTVRLIANSQELDEQPPGTVIVDARGKAFCRDPQVVAKVYVYGEDES